MKSFRMNFDYEYELFQAEYKNKRKKYEKKMSEWEFLYFFLTVDFKSSLYSLRKYSELYLKKVRSIGGYVPSFRDKFTHNYIGPLTDLEKEKKFNSKTYSYEILKEIMPNMKAKVVNSKKEILDYMEEGVPYILKDPFGLSGIGFKRITKEDDIPEIRKTYILEREYERFLDCSWIIGQGEDKLLINHITKNFEYRGSLYLKDQEQLKEKILALIAEEFEVYKDKIKKIIGDGEYSIDFFIYKEGSIYKIHPVCEINYRKTLGLVPIRFSEILNKDNVFFEISKDSKESEENTILISPEDNFFKSYISTYKSSEKALSRCFPAL